MFRKILVANRGEIAIRAFRAAYELGAKTVAVYPFEDRNSLHRLKADEAYQIGEEGHPVRAYLDVSEIIRVATESGADAIYPGYGFLSENPDLAEAAAANGITFIGPANDVLEMAGNKVTAKEHAISAGVPVLKSTEATTDIEALLAGADEIGFPVFAKAVAGGGGRGMRRVETREELRPALEAAMNAVAEGTSLTLDRGLERLGDHTYLVRDDQSMPQEERSWTVAQSEVFVIGDNRANSHDSRTWFAGEGGGVKLDKVIGRATFRVFRAGGLSFGHVDDLALPQGAEGLGQALAKCRAELGG